MRRIEPLNRADHDRNSFDCGDPALNQFLQRHAAQQADRGISQTFVLVEATSENEQRQIVGYFTLRPYQLSREQLPETIRSGYTDTIGAFLLAKLAVHNEHKGKGLGTKLLREVFNRVIRLIEEAGGVGLFVDAKSVEIVSFYTDRGFTQLSANSLALYLPKRTLESIVSKTPSLINFDDTPFLPM